MLLNSIVAVVIIVIAIFTVKKYKMSMKYGCCGSADSGEGRRVEVADKNPEDYPYTAVLDKYRKKYKNVMGAFSITFLFYKNGIFRADMPYSY